MIKLVLVVLLAITILNIQVHCEENRNDNAKPLERQGCGWSNSDGIGLQIDQNLEGTSKFGEFPWMMALLKITELGGNLKPLNMYKGGGSLIHPNVVLTAAHLVVNLEPAVLKVRAGEWDTQSTKEIYPHQDRTVNSIVIHEKYGKVNLFHNVALLFLDEPLDMAPNVGTVCLPKSQQSPQPGTRCFSLGWGKDKLIAGSYSPVLKKVELPVVSHEECQEKFRKTRIGNRFELHPTFMCAGEEGKYFCKGDGGSPLVCPMEAKDRYVQNGIAAWNLGCQGDPPSVYVDVAVLREWIDEKVKEKGFQTNSYSDY